MKFYRKGTGIMNKETPSWLPIVITVLISIYLLVIFHITVNLSNPQDIHPVHYLILLLGVLIPLVPFIQKLRIGKIVELERNVQQQKDEVRDFKNEVRQLISVVSTSVNSISNLSNTTNVNIDFANLLRQAKEQLSQANLGPESQEIQEVKREMLLDNEDTIMALARTRIQLEQLLRKVLGKRMQYGNKTLDNVKYLSAGRLYRMFLEEYDNYAYLERSFDYVLKICNAAIHGQQIPSWQAQEALDLGARLISTLNEIIDDNNNF